MSPFCKVAPKQILTLLKVFKFLFSNHLLRNDAATFWYLSLYLTEQIIRIHATFLPFYLLSQRTSSPKCFKNYSTFTQQIIAQLHNPRPIRIKKNLRIHFGQSWLGGGKDHIFWEGHKNFLTATSASQKKVEISQNFCGLLRIYELYLPLAKKYTRPFKQVSPVQNLFSQKYTD